MSVPPSPEVGEPVGEFIERAYHDHGAAVFALARGLCGPTMAAEVSQDVFVRLWTDPDRFNPHLGSVRTLLLTSCRSRAIDMLRSDAARGRRERVVHRQPTGPGGMDVEAGAVAHDDRSQIMVVLDRLPVGERDAIVTTFYGGCTYREAAEVLDQPEGTVKSRIRRGLMHLRGLLADQISVDDGNIDLTGDSTV